MSASSPSPLPSDGAGAAARRAARDRWTAVLLLLPPAVLCLPFLGAPLARDPYPHLAGAGWLALLACPLVPLAWGRVRASAGLALLALVLVAGAASALLRDVSDTAELRRAGVHGAAVLALFAGGSALGTAGRDVLLRGSAALALAALFGAFTLRELELAGTLGNTGALSQAALPGAVAGLLLAVRGRADGGVPARWRVPAHWRVAGALAFAGFAAHAGRAPVLAGVLAAGGALLLAAALARGLSRSARVALVCGAAALPLAFLALRWAPAASGGRLEAEVAGDTTGVGVRLAVWRRVPALLGDHLLFGVGPGQLQAAFPPYRDPAEIVASAHGSCEHHGTEIDHLHADPLHVPAELGLAGGLPWLAFLVLVAWRGLAALRGAEPVRAALGAGGIALCASALVHSPLVHHPASAAIGFALFGALAAPPGEPPARSRKARRGALPSLALVPVLAVALLGWPLVRHGRALTAAGEGRNAAQRAAEAGEHDRIWDARRRWLVYRDARAALPDSVPALHLEAESSFVDLELGDALRDVPPESLRARGVELAELLAADPRPALERILALRPHDQLAHRNLALLAARRGDLDAARAHDEAVLAIDPGHPPALRALAELELERGDAARGMAHVDALAATGCLRIAWLADLAARLLFDGRGALAVELLARDDPRFAAPATWTGDVAIALSRALEVEGRSELAYGLESHAHHLWAREHVEHASYGNAVRSYRQALRPTTARHPSGAPLLRLELAAAQLLALDAEGAAKTALGLSVALPVARHLPDWARAALADAGF